MKKERLSMVAICATVITLLVVFALPSGASTTVSQQRVKGGEADALFESVDGSGCVVTDTSVSGFQLSQSKNTGLPSGASAEVTVSEFDQCSGTQLVAAIGQAALPAGAFSIDTKGLTAASLVGSVDVTDIFTSNSFTVDLNVAWTGSGGVSTSKSHTQQKSGGFTLIENFHGASSNNATANGTVSTGGSTLTSGDALFADLLNVNAGLIQIAKS
jgi:hypothetical protein